MCLLLNSKICTVKKNEISFFVKIIYEKNVFWPHLTIFSKRERDKIRSQTVHIHICAILKLAKFTLFDIKN